MNTYYVGSIPISDELYHHGIIGQKWGVRRYQNEDGSLTAAGRKKYGYTDSGKETGANSGYKSKRSANKNEEDNVAYKYNKAGESGWKGLGRAIKAKSSGASSFVSRHKKGLAVAGGILAAGVAAYAITKVVNNGTAANGVNAVKNILSSKDGYDPKGTVFNIKTDKGDISGYYSPEYADFLRKMNNGSLPGSHAKNFTSMTKEVADFAKRRK